MDAYQGQEGLEYQHDCHVDHRGLLAVFFRDLGLGLGQRRGSGSALLNNIVSYWKMNEFSDASAPVTRIDSVTAIGNDLTDNNTTASEAGIISNAANFIAANTETLNRASNASLELGGNQLFTLTGWIRFRTIAPAGLTSNIIDKVGGGGEGVWKVFNNFGTLTFTVYTAEFSAGGVSAIGTANVIDTWYFFAAWYDGANVNLSINNGATNSSANVTSAWDGAPKPDLRFGSGYTGDVDEVGFWKRVLTAGERTALYNGGAGLTYPF